MSKTKRNALALLCMGTILILILAISLPSLVLSPGQPFSLGEAQQQALGANGVLPGGSMLVLIFRGMVALALVFSHSILSILNDKQGRQRLIADLVVLALLFLLATYLQKLPPKDNAQEQQQILGAPQTKDEAPGIPDSVFVAEPPTWLTP